MKLLNTILLSLTLIIIGACEKKEFESNPPVPPVSVNTDSSLIISDYYTLNGQKWLLYGYRIGEFGNMVSRNDTLNFISKFDYLFNKVGSTYTLAPSSATFTLSLNGTFVGNITGTIYVYNLKVGSIDGLKFRDISYNNNISTSYYIWLKKI